MNEKNRETESITTASTPLDGRNEGITRGYEKEIKVLDHGLVRYMTHMGSDTDIVQSARVSYRGDSKGETKDRELLERLYRDKHTSPFEMVKLKLYLKMPIFIARQYVRHRMQSLNELSARYRELSDQFYIPSHWRKQNPDPHDKQGSIAIHEWVPRTEDGASAAEVVESACKNAFWAYKELLNAGVAREMARMVLPLNIYTEMVVCWDLKNLLHFLTLREDKHAQWEHQQYGLAIKQICIDLFPWTMAAYEKYKWGIIVPGNPIDGI